MRHPTEHAKITEQKQVRMLKCMKWCVCEEGIADICGVTRATVRLFQKKAATRAKCHHDNEVHSVSEEGAQCDELYAKLSWEKIMARCSDWYAVFDDTCGRRREKTTGNGSLCNQTLCMFLDTCLCSEFQRD